MVPTVELECVSVASFAQPVLAQVWPQGNTIFSEPGDPGPRDMNWHTLYVYVHDVSHSIFI